MWVVSLFALSVMVAPAEVPAGPSDVRLVQDDDFGDPPPPPPPAIEDELDDAPPLPPPTSGSERQREPKRSPRAAAPASDEEPGFFDQYFPFALSDDLHPAVDDIIWSFWVANLVPIVPFAQIWLPVVLLEPDTPDGYLVDAIIVYASHLAPHAVLFAIGFPLLILGAVPYIGWFVFLPCGLLCNGLNFAGLLANAWYLMPVAFANNLSRRLKIEDGEIASRNEWLERRREQDLAMAY